MKNIFLMLALVAISACSKNEKGSSGVNQELSDIKDEIVFEALSVRTSSVDGQNTIPASTLDFATLQPKQSGTQDLIITNGLSTELVFGASDIDASSISPFVMTESCSNKTIARNRSCKLTFSVLNNPNPVETVLTKSLTIKGSVIQLTATLAADTTPVNAPIVSLIVSPMHLDFGSMKDGEQKELSIAVTNKGSSAQTISAPVISNPKIAITSNTCSSLARNRSCSIKIRYSASTDESIVQQSFTSIANNDIKHSVLVQSPTVSEPQVLTINPAIASSNLSLNEPQVQTSTLSFTNTGTVELPSPIQAIAQPSTGVTINSVSCTGGLSRGRNCSVSYSLNSTLLAGGASQVQLKLQSGTLASNIHTVNLNVTKLATPCTIADAQANGWNTDNQSSIGGMKTGSDVSQCIVQSCNQYFSVNSSGKSCDADICTVDNAPNFGVNLSNVSAVSGNTPNCIVASCSNSSLYDIAPDQKSCVDKPLDCTLVDAQANGWNIANAQTPTGIKVGSNLSQCSVSVCNTNFSLNTTTKSCDAISCILVNASGNGITSLLNVATVSGSLPNCSVSTCDSNYKPAVDSKSCVEKLCNELSAGELSAIGFNTTNATISGTYPSCSISCNSSLQQLAGDSKSCVDKTPSGSISFVQDVTKNLGGNLLNITQIDAQQIQFYSDASCSTTVGGPLSMPLTQTLINLSIGDGNKDAYAKLINGSASSACLTDTIFLDQTSPLINFTSHINNATFEGNSITITGTCSDNYNSNTNIPINVYLGTASGSTGCQASGIFSITLDVTSLSSGIYTLEAASWDTAGNTTSNQISLEKIVPAFIDDIPESSYDNLYFFARENITNHRGNELFKIDSNYNVTFEKDLTEFGTGYISGNPGVNTLVKLDDNNLYINRSVVATTSSLGLVNRTNSILKINPSQTYLTEITENGLNAPTSSLYYSISSGKYLYYNQVESSIKMTSDLTNLTSAISISASSALFNAIEFNGKTYMLITDNTGPSAVYYVKTLSSNGTVQTVATTTANSLFPSSAFIIFKNKLYIIGNIGSSGYKLFLVNESTGSFDLVPHNPATMSAYSSIAYTSGRPVVVTSGANSVLVFSCTVTPIGQSSQTELCVYDGTNPFGVLNINTTATTSSSTPSNLTVFAGKVAFRASVTTITGVQVGTEFAVYDPGNYTDLYNINKVYIKDLSTALITNSSNPGGFAEYTVNGNQRLVMSASTGSTPTFYTWDGQLPIVVSDLGVPNTGTQATTITQSQPNAYIISNNYLYYPYLIGGTDYEVAVCNLAACNLTTNGRFYDIFTGSTGSVTISSLNRQFIELGDYIYFHGGAEAMGSNWPTKILRFNKNNPLSYPEVAGEYNSSVGSAMGWMKFINGDIVYLGNDADKTNFHGSFRFDDIFNYSIQTEQKQSLNLTNGIQSSILTANTSASNIRTNSNNAVVYNNMIYFDGDMGDGKGIELLVSNGNSTPTNLDIFTGSSGSLPLNLSVLNLKNPTTNITRPVLIFQATDQNGTGVFIIDGNSVPQKLATLTSATSFKSFKGKIYFIGTQSATGRELWVTDGTISGTNIVADKNTGAGNFLTASNDMLFPINLINGGYKLCMIGFTSTEGNELYCFDGDNWSMTEIVSGASGLSTQIIVPFQGKLLVASPISNARGVAFDGTSYSTVSTSFYPWGSGFGNKYIVLNNKVYYTCGFTTPSLTVDSELCIYDGTTVTQLNINVDTDASSNPQNLIKYKDRVIFNITASTSSENLNGVIKIIDSLDNTNQVNNLISSEGRTLIHSLNLSLPFAYETIE